MIDNDPQFSELTLTNNPGVLLSKLPQPVFESLKTSAESAIKDKISKASVLVGMIEELYAIQLDSDVMDYLVLMTSQYQKKFNFKLSHVVEFKNPWINVQKKYEYSPIHYHPHTLGWVAWVKIPYNIQDERDMPNSIHSKVKKNSNFEFVYSKLSGEIQTHSMSLDGSYEGTVMMFPSYLKHVVYPFYTSDDYRISVAGNILLK